MRLVCATFGALGLFLLGFAVASALGGALGSGMIYLAVSALCFYPAYLLGRAALRIRREQAASPLPPDAERSRRKRSDAIMLYTILSILGVLILPNSTGVKVVVVVVGIVVAAVLVAFDDEPSKKSTKRS